jgi:nucleoside-diphosphate-sugar epimerase
MKIYVTGASGFVGGAVVKALKDNHELLAMSRSEKSDAKIAALGARPVRAQLGRVTPESLAGVDVIVHCAAYVEDWGPWREYWDVNVQGTKQLIEAAKAAGVKRFVHIGTEAALFKGQPMVNVDETYPLALDSPFPYSRTKAHAEKAVREANSAAFTTIVLRPRMIWGPDDQTLLPVIMEMVKKGSFAWIDGGKAKTSTTYIGNLVQGVELSLTKGRGGEAYFVLDDAVLEFRDFVTRMLAAAGVVAPTRSVPSSMLRVVAFASEKLYRALPFLPGKPPITRFAANIMAVDCVLVDKKIRADMGYAPGTDLEQGLAALKDSLRR